ncbi:MAG: cupin-like domain-containing protein, partial [Pseudobdellovibrionaceae bacterium]|nr:cupin-like domain-containing protein [Pseudobdellovibrionaceae bacterium]
MIASKPISRSNAIPLFNAADTASFHQRHIDGFGLPAIIKGAIDHWPARHKWTLDYFTDLIGDTEVTLKTNLINPKSQQTRQVFRDFVAGIKTGTFEAHLDESGLRFSPYFICNMGMFQQHNLLADV